MSNGGHDRFEVPAQPVQRRAAGVLSARIVALAMAGLLAAVVGTAVVGRAEPPKVADSAADMRAGQSASAPPTASPATQRSSAAKPTDSPPNPRPPAVAPAAAQYVATGSVGGRAFRARLDEVRPGLLTGDYWLPDPPNGDDLTFEIVAIERAGTWIYQEVGSIGTWELSLSELAGNHRSGHEPLTVSVPARPKLLGAPPIVQRGYELGVYVRLAYDEVVVVDFHLDVGTPARPKTNDGMPGWPVSGALG